jgi:hypothetical protein
MSSDTRPEETRAPHAPEGEAPRWLDNRRNVDKIVYALYAVCAGLLLIDPLVEKHGPFEIEHWWGFYGIYGFVGCVFLVLAAKVLRMIVMRPEDYYDRR